MTTEGIMDVLLLPTLEHLDLTCQYYQPPYTREQSLRFISRMVSENSSNPTFLPKLKTLSYCDQSPGTVSGGELITIFKQIAEDPRRAWDATVEQRDSPSKESRKEQVSPQDHTIVHMCRLEKAELVLRSRRRPVYLLVANPP